MNRPGALLARARADLHLSHEDVAGKLHLSQKQIAALETDDYSALPGPTYVRGYLKSYALLLGLEPKLILDVHSKLTAKPAPSDFTTIAPQREVTSRHHQIRFVTYLVAAIVVGLAIAWWQSRDVRPANPALSGNETAPAAPELTGPVPPPVEAPVATTETVPAAQGAAAPAGATSVVPPPAATAPAKPAAAPVVTPTPLAATPAPLPATGPRARVVISADQDTWVDIRDARQVKLLYETVPAGRTVTLEGIAPVNVFLGNAGGARMEYNGKPIDIQQYQRGVVARFTLGGEEAAATPPAH